MLYQNFTMHVLFLC